MEEGCRRTMSRDLLSDGSADQGEARVLVHHDGHGDGSSPSSQMDYDLEEAAPLQDQEAPTHVQGPLGQGSESEGGVVIGQEASSAPEYFVQQAGGVGQVADAHEHDQGVPVQRCEGRELPQPQQDRCREESHEHDQGVPVGRGAGQGPSQPQQGSCHEESRQGEQVQRNEDAGDDRDEQHHGGSPGARGEGQGLMVNARDHDGAVLDEVNDGNGHAGPWEKETEHGEGQECVREGDASSASGDPLSSRLGERRETNQQGGPETAGKEESDKEDDHVMLMAWDSDIPPWRRTYTVRDRWLKRGNDEGWRRRRYRDRKGQHWRGSSPPSRTKGKGKAKSNKAAKAKPKARPFTIWSASGRKDWPDEECEGEGEEDGDNEVVEVEDESEQASASTPGPRPDAEPCTVENAMHLWREFLDMEDEGELGYPSWALDRVRDTIEDWPAEDVSVLLAAHQQFLSLVMAQVAEIAQRRISRAREESRNRRPDGDATSLMQASRTVQAAEAEISTYGLELQFLTDEFSAMDENRARVRSSLIRGLLAKRYGCASGRLAMGARAMALEAAVVAFDDENSAVESEVPET